MTASGMPGVLERPTSTIAGASPEDLTGRLDAALALLDPAAVRIVRLGNPLRQRLTLRRLLLQISILDERSESDEAAIANVLGRSWGEESHVVLVIEQADSLAPDAAQFLAALARSFQGRAPSLHVVFAGSLAVMDLDLDAAPPGPPRAGRTLPESAPSSVAIPQPPTAAWPASPPQQPAPRRWKRFGLIAAVLALCLLAGAALTVGPSLRGRPAAAGQDGGTAMPKADAAPAPGPVEPTAGPTPAAPPILPPAAAVTPEPTPEPASESNPALNAPAFTGEDTARLRKDFNRFLTRSGRSRTALTGAQREALFNDYLQWRARQASDPPR